VAARSGPYYVGSIEWPALFPRGVIAPKPGRSTRWQILGAP
jgi:hypothetical protein